MVYIYYFCKHELISVFEYVNIAFNYDFWF